MSIVRSRMTSQGQVSVPAEIRRRLGLAPGSVLEWDIEGNHATLRRRGRCSTSDVHEVLFPEGPPLPRTLEEMKAGIPREIRRRHARD
jgi:antitoxin PrlF